MSGPPNPSPIEEPNPYQSPQTPVALTNEVPQANLRLVKTLRDFRSQIVALGAFWIIIGAIASAIGVYATASLDEPMMLIIFGVIGLTWVVLGGLVCMKQMWALYVALTLSYISLIGNLVRFQICSIVFSIVVILQAHRVLRWSKELTAAGIPLTTRPEDLHIQISIPI